MEKGCLLQNFKFQSQYLGVNFDNYEIYLNGNFNHFRIIVPICFAVSTITEVLKMGEDFV